MVEKNNIFITGIDTDIGKTFVSIALCNFFKKQGKKVGYYKPFQSGAYKENGISKAPDVVEIEKKLDIKTGFSYLLEGEVSPYLASKLANISIDIKKVKNDIDFFSSDLDITVIEGAGGLCCPIYEDILFCDFIKYLDIPTYIVTTPKLGRLNHTIMTLKVAKEKGIDVKGLILNNIPFNCSTSEKYFIEELSAFYNIQIVSKIQINANINDIFFKIPITD